jgi:hypothetical protein
MIGQFSLHHESYCPLTQTGKFQALPGVTLASNTERNHLPDW